VTVTGSPTISLGTGAPVTTNVAYVSGSLSNTLNFTYTVAAGNFTPRLDHAGAIFNGSISGTTLTIADPGVESGAVAVGQTLLGPGVTPGTTIVSGSGASWTVSIAQTTGQTRIAALAIATSASGVAIRDTTAQNQLIVANVVTAVPPGTSGLFTKNIGVDAIHRVASITSLPSTSGSYPLGTGSSVDVQMNFPDAVIVTGAPARFSGSISGTTLTVDSVTAGPIAAGQTLTGAAADFTGSITGNILTVSAVSSGTLAAGQTIYGQGVPGNTKILEFGTFGTVGAGLQGTYALSTSIPTSPLTGAQATTVLTVTVLPNGTLAPGQTLSLPGSPVILSKRPRRRHRPAVLAPTTSVAPPRRSRAVR